MDWEFVAPMIVTVTLFLSAAGVLILRPLTKRLGDLLESMQQQRQSQLKSSELQRIADLLEHMDSRIDRLEDRQDFTERMLTALEDRGQRERAAIKAPKEGRG